MLSLTMIMPTPMKMGTIAKPYQLSTLLSDSPRILNYLRSLCVELSQLYEAENSVMKEVIAILTRLKLERTQLTFTVRNGCLSYCIRGFA